MNGAFNTSNLTVSDERNNAAHMFSVLSRMETEIVQILSDLGIPDHIKAHAYLKEMILTAVNDPSASTPYERLAREDNVTKPFVHSTIRDAIGTYLSKDYKSILSDHFGHPVQNERARPTAEELVEMIATNLRLKYQSQPETAN